MSKKIIIILTVFVLLLVAGSIFFFAQKIEDQRFEKLKADYPNLVVYIDDVIKAEDELAKDSNNIENYTTLGLAWKSLADWSQSEGLENYKDYYQKALEVYQAGIDKSQRRNTLLMANAGNMAKYLAEYNLAEEYYKEAIAVSPGDESYYALLGELYEYELGKSKEEVVAVYEQGMKRVLRPAWLEARKKAYLERSGN